MKHFLPILFLVAGFFFLALGANAENNFPLHVWTQMGPRPSYFLLRAIIDHGECPQVSFKKTKALKASTLALHKKNTTAEDTFSAQLCEAELPIKIFSASLGNIPLALPKAEPKKIIVIGDTGCRTKGFIIQNCNSPKDWPFAQVVQSALTWKPDLVLHMGDYHYRETPCPEGIAGCKGITPGDNWKSWQEDFFTPADPLLRSAPWIMVRGNHESCERGGQGWIHLLDPFPAKEKCSNASDPYKVSLGAQSIWVVDSADTNAMISSLAWIQKKSAGKKSALWVLTHRPFLAENADDDVKRGTKQKLSLPERMTLSLVGHLHRLRITSFADSRPPELIGGNSGDLLDAKPDQLASDAMRVKKDDELHYTALERFDFGYLSLEKIRDGRWKMEEHSVDGKTVLHCIFHELIGGKPSIICDK